MTDIALLIHRFLKEELNDEEIRELEYWKQESETNRRIFERLTDDQYLLQAVSDGFKIDSDEVARHKIHKLIGIDQQIIDKPEEIQTANVKPMWPRFAVAAAILCLIAFSAVYILHKSKQPGVAEIQQRNEKQDISPGKYKAKLTLADGTVIILDSAKSGRLVQQGGLIVLNKDGKLTYEKVGETNKVLYNTLTTTKGETYATVLSDGSKVWLNSQSSLRYPISFNGDVRKVEITGEAYFEVAPSVALLSNGQKGKRPFVVSANGMEIEVLGTHFNVNSYTDEPAMKTTLLEGKVKVRSTTTNEQTILMPGEQAIIRQAEDDKAELVKTRDVDVDAEVAWRFGMFQFNNADLKTVMRQLERWYDVQVVYEDNVDNFEFLGKIPRNMNLSQVLTILQNVNVHFKMEGNKIIVTP